jgi:SAM-dependent methyltransferase
MSKIKTTKTNDNTLKTVKEHYEDYPYPFRDPKDEAKRLLSTCGDGLLEINHFLYKGKKNFDSNFRCLIAGGGTGDAAIYMAEQLKNNGSEIVYLDFSKPSMRVAQERAKERGLTNIKWVHDSILNIGNLDLGQFDYVNCSGVLHHLASPPDGLMALKNSLKSDGGMHIMVYAKYGRTAIYQIQELMKLVNHGVTNRVEEVMNGKIILSSLPSTNWYNHLPFTDYQSFGDIGLYDMFLHKQDRCYSIPQLYEFIENAGLHFVEFTDPTYIHSYKIENYIKDFSLLQKIKTMDIVTQRAICEILVGNIIKHSFYVSNQKDSIATLDDLNQIIFMTSSAATFAKQVYDHMEANNSLTIGNFITYTINGGLLDKTIINIPISYYTKYIFKQLIDNDKTLLEIFDSVRGELQNEVSNKILLEAIKEIFIPLNEVGIMLLRNKQTN